jgi:hypothetical protein
LLDPVEEPFDEIARTIQHATVVYTPSAARLVGQHRLDGGPLIIAEFLAHDSRLQFRSLNHFVAEPLML